MWGGTDTRKHALVDYAGSADQNGIARHDGPIGRNDYDITRDKVSGHGLLDFCEKNLNW